MIVNNCRGCAHMRTILGNCHIRCVNPDPDMTGSDHGIRNGWFAYPWIFDPIWMESKCKNFEPKKSFNDSPALSLNLCIRNPCQGWGCRHVMALLLVAIKCESSP